MRNTYHIVRTYNICGREEECLCYDAGCAITYSETDAQAKVAALKAMGYADARYIEVAAGSAWYTDNRWIG